MAVFFSLAMSERRMLKAFDKEIMKEVQRLEIAGTDAEDNSTNSTDVGTLPTPPERTERAHGTAPSLGGTVGFLTEPQLAVLQLLPTRLSTREIGRELSVSVTTIRTQVQAIYRKLQVSSRSEAVARARQLGLLPPTSTDP
jgi:DNA-binding NarL/FixJ family response regulator